MADQWPNVIVVKRKEQTVMMAHIIISAFFWGVLALSIAAIVATIKEA
jgi:hypothetical protein